jgi:hypothetical protein
MPLRTAFTPPTPVGGTAARTMDLAGNLADPPGPNPATWGLMVSRAIAAEGSIPAFRSTAPIMRPRPRPERPRPGRTGSASRSMQWQS